MKSKYLVESKLEKAKVKRFGIKKEKVAKFAKKYHKNCSK